MKRFYGLCFLILSGCLANGNIALSTESMATENIYHLTKVSVGMTKKEVFQVMRHPYKQENFLIDGNTYEVWFYVTRMTALGQSRLVPQNLTPLTFRNGVLIGWGSSHYKYLLEKEEEILSPPPKKEKESDESRAIEDVLKPPKRAMPNTKGQRGAASQSNLEKEPPPATSKKDPKAPEQPKGPVQPKPPIQKPLKEPKPPKQPEAKQPNDPAQPPIQKTISDAKGAVSQPDPEEEDPYLDDEGEEMMDEEREENFDFY